MTRRRAAPRSAVALALMVSAGACGSGPTGTPVDSCPANEVSGTLETLGQRIGIMTGGRHLVLTWSGGYRDATVDGERVIVGPTGEVAARVGDEVRLLGGELRVGEFHACGIG